MVTQPIGVYPIISRPRRIGCRFGNVNDNFSSHKLFSADRLTSKMKPNPERLVLHNGGD
jgi:hypothetical protein